MLKQRVGMVCLMAAVMLLCGSAAEAQKTETVAMAPLPAQILAAKKVFIGNAGGDFDPDVWTGGPARLYNEFYASMKSWGRYELVGAPADADLVMELSLSTQVGATNVYSGSGGSKMNVQLRLALVDPKTHICLWGLNKGKAVALLKENRDKDFDQLLAGLVEDLKALTTPTANGGGGR